MNAILVAYEGRLDMFETIGWIKRGETPPAQQWQQSSREMTAEMFDAVFG